MGQDAELEAFKSGIDLRVYLSSLGFGLDRRESSRASAVMRRGDEKLIVKQEDGGHFVYFSVHDPADHGSIIDFVQKRRHLNLGQVRKELRPWLVRPAPGLPLFPTLARSARDRGLVEAAFAGFLDARAHPYLVEVRGIPPALLASGRFAGCARMDARRNAIFPHVDEAGDPCGYEIKNRGFTGFARGGEKGVWRSNDLEGDRRIVWAESAIDALSYAALFPDAGTRYRSIGGAMNARQPGLVQAEIARMPEGSEIVAAFDADDAGRALAGILDRAVRQAALDTGKSFPFRLDLPHREGADWNQILLERSPVLFPTAQNRRHG